MAVLFLAALGGQLVASVFLLKVAALAGLLATAVDFALKRNAFGWPSASVSIFALASIGLTAFYAVKWLPDFRFLGWDEFSHWALITKYILADERLFDADTGVLFKSYPPGAALIHFFFATSFGPINEFEVVFSHFLLFVAGLIASAGVLADRARGFGPDP
nr:hypothetical protein [Pseudomonas sp.]